MSNVRIEVRRRRATEAFENLIRKYWGDYYAEKGESIQEVWITHENENGMCVGYDVLTTPKRDEKIPQGEAGL